MRWPAVGTVSSIVTGVLVVGAAGALALWGDDVPVDPPGLAVEQTTVTVPPLARTLACPSQARMTDDDVVGDSEFTTTADTSSAAVAGVVGSTPATVGALGQEGTALPLGPDAAVGVSDPAVEATWLAVDPGPDGGGDRAAAAARSTTTVGDLRGLAAGECRTPGVSQWLVGGSTEVGSSTQLVLQNPGTTPAAVAVTIWGPGGSVDVTGSDRFVVPPGDQVVSILEGAAPEQPRTVVHVEAEGGLVTSYLQHTTVDGISAAGTDLVTAGAEPSTSLTVPGVLSEGQDVGADDAPVLRLLAPGDQDATATVTLHGPDGERSVPGLDQLSLSAGRVVEVGLGGLAPGAYSVVVSADQPIVGGVELRRAGEPDPDSTRGALQVDRAWISAQTEGATAGAAALPPGVRGTLVITSAKATTVTVTGYDGDGAVAGDSELVLPGASTATVPVADLGDGIRLVTVDGATWNVILDAGDPAPDAPDAAPGSLVSSLSPVPAGPGPRDVVVRVDDSVGQG